VLLQFPNLHIFYTPEKRLVYGFFVASHRFRGTDPLITFDQVLFIDDPNNNTKPGQAEPTKQVYFR
jgi:hypothetical protein